MDIERKKNIAVLASGGGSNLASIINAINDNMLTNVNIALVISDRENAYALTRATDAGIPAVYVKRSLYASDEEYDVFITETLKSYNTDIVVLAGYLRIITEPFLKAFENKILNIHPSLLPDFGGKGMYGMKVHQSVINSKAQKSGCTVHLVTKEVDGGPILDRAIVSVMPEDTPEILAAKVLKEEHKLYPKALSDFISAL